MSLFGQEDSLRALQELLTAGSPDQSGEPVVGTGTALDDQVTVSFADGTVSAVELGPRAKRSDDVTLATAI